MQFKTFTQKDFMTNTVTVTLSSFNLLDQVEYDQVISYQTRNM